MIERVVWYILDRQERRRTDLDANVSDLLLILSSVLVFIGSLIVIDTGGWLSTIVIWIVAVLVFALSVYLWAEW